MRTAPGMAKAKEKSVSVHISVAVNVPMTAAEKAENGTHTELPPA